MVVATRTKTTEEPRRRETDIPVLMSQSTYPDFSSCTVLHYRLFDTLVNCIEVAIDLVNMANLVYIKKGKNSIIAQ